MRDSTRQQNVVSAVRVGSRGAIDPRTRRRIFGGLFLAAIVAIAIVSLTHERHVRGWAAAIAVVCVLLIVIAWLAGASRSLSTSGRDPSDFSGSADSL